MGGSTGDDSYDHTITDKVQAYRWPMSSDYNDNYNDNDDDDDDDDHTITDKVQAYRWSM